MADAKIEWETLRKGWAKGGEKVEGGKGANEGKAIPIKRK